MAWSLKFKQPLDTGNHRVIDLQAVPAPCVRTVRARARRAALAQRLDVAFSYMRILSGNHGGNHVVAGRCSNQWHYDCFVAMRAIREGSLVEFSPDEVERHLQRAVEELRIMRSRRNIYFK